MQKRPATRYKPLGQLDRALGIRVQYFRRLCNLSQIEFAKKIGATKHQVVNVESCRVPLKMGMAWATCKLFDVHPTCLLDETKRLPFPPRDLPVFPRVEKIVLASRDGKFSDVWPPLVWLFGEDATNIGETALTSVNADVNTSTVNADMKRLLDKLKRVTREPGRKAKLARKLRLPIASVSAWVSGNRKPSGERALELDRLLDDPESWS